MKAIQLLSILIPQRLTDVAHWVGWKQEIRNAELTKVPYNVRTLKMAKVNEPATWSTYKTSLDAAQRGLVIGISYVLAKDDYLTFIDLDDCRDADTGAISDEARYWIQRFNSYTEESQSGKECTVAMGKGAFERSSEAIETVRKVFCITEATA